MNERIIVNHKTFTSLSKNNKITECGVYVYLCLKPMVNKSYTHIFTSVNAINRTLSDEDIKRNNATLVKYIKTGLKELDDADYIKIINNHNSEFELDLDGMVEDKTITVEVEQDNPFDAQKYEEQTNYFTIFNATDLRQALKDSGNKKVIFYYLSRFMGLLNGYYFLMGREQLANECNLDVRSIDKYNEILMNDNIIYYVRYDYKYLNSHKQVNNMYGLYENRVELDKEKDKFLKEHKDDIYLSSIPRGKGSKKQKEEKKAQYTPVEADEFVVTDEELAEHDKRHKELYAKRMEKAVMTESVSMQEVDKTVKADDNEPIDYDTVIAERKAENRVILYDDSNKEVETDDDDSEESSLDKYTKPKETTVNIEYCLNISSKKEAIRVYAAQLEHDDPFDDDNVQPKLVAEFADKWDEHNKEEINPFA